ncbi:MAG: tRNA pseudouridine(55) synthase TruB [Bacteroidales bacterium]|nr:tRNA pseudouridine(55) synthase TruB [Bacteroidales bacterium]
MGYFDIEDLQDLVEGRVLLMDKPLFWTSFDLVKKTRAILERQMRLKTGERAKLKVGHAGTLDPLADGLMLLGTGKKTKILYSLTGQEKEYITTLELGKTTPSFDLETMFDHEYSLSDVRDQDIYTALERFTGEIDQIPPVYSAKNIKGQRAYHAARKGQAIEMKPVRVRIHQIEMIRLSLPLLTLRVRCNKGTYIRSLARDIGEALGCGAHLAGLKRIRIGDYHLKEAVSIEKFEQFARNL